MDAVIALHGFVFRPYAGQPTAILILTKGGPRKPIWFYKVDDDGFDRTTRKTGRRATNTGRNDLLTLRSVWADKPDAANAITVPLRHVRQHGYKLSYSAYRPRDERANWTPLGGTDGVCDIRLGATPARKKESYWRNGTLPWATITDITNCATRYLRCTAEAITPLAARETSVKLLPAGTVLLSFKLSIGKTAITEIDLYTNEAIVGLVPKDNRVLPEYLYFLLPFLDIAEYSQPATKGDTLNKSILQEIPIPVPALGQQREFIKVMTQQEAEAVGLREQAADIERHQRDDAYRFIADQ